MTARVSVVVGGASGIGWATAQLLHFQGDTVVIADVAEDAALACATELGEHASGRHVQVTDESSVRALFDAVRTEHGAVNAVVNCAGVSHPGALVDLPLYDWKATLDVCLTGTFLVLREAAKVMEDGGAIVAISSPIGHRPGAATGANCTAKAGVLRLTRVAALELGPRRIRVNALSPGFVHTPPAAGATLAPEFVEDTPLGRVGDPDDVAQAVAFLLSEQADWMTGATLDLGGGAHLPHPDVLTRVSAMTD
ncbi:SDR family NAD(P)-dependent oxidoreductase [Rhodococcus sp. NPDC003322]